MLQMALKWTRIVAERRVSSMSGCYHQIMPVKRLEKSSSWILKGNFDGTRFDGNNREGWKASRKM